MPLNAHDILVEHQGVFLDRGCLFVSTAEARPGVPKLLTGYVNCEVIYPHFEVVWDLVGQLVEPFLGEVEGFVCPATGDIVLAEYATIMANQQGWKTKAVWADKQPDNSYRIERNGFASSIRGKRVLILNDRISQGGTTLKVIAEARRMGCEVLGVATLSSVSSVNPDKLGVPRLHSLSTMDVDNFPADDIPEGFRGQPIVIDEPLGHGAHFQVKHPDFRGGFTKLLS